MTTPTTMAVSTLCRDLLGGPRTALTTAYRGRDAWLLTKELPSAVSLLTPHAVLLPRSVIVPELPSGSPRVRIGGGALWFDDQRVMVSRWFTPSSVVRGMLRHRAPAGSSNRRFLDGWSDHLGEGDGLTPYGDDVICGVMLGLLAADHADADRLAHEIRCADLDSRTTAVSAALLRSASDGWCIPEVERVMVALSSERPLEPAVERLLAVGHSSGRGLLAGLASVVDLRRLDRAA